LKEIEKITEAAAILYRSGVKFKVAIGKALDQNSVTDPTKRETLYKEVCSRLGRRGGKKKKPKREKKPIQLAIDFSK